MKGIRKEWIKFLILISIIVLGSFLRLYKIGKESLWNDELASWERSNQKTLKEVIEVARSDVHPPGYQILLYFVIKYLGDSESWLRLPSAIAGIFSILLIYLIGRKIYSEWEGLISSALMAFLWFPIYYSQEARAYSLLLLFTMLSFYFWIKIIEKGKDRKGNFLNFFFFVLSSCITSYLHYFGLLFVILLFIGTVVLFFKNKKILTFLFLFFLIFLLYLPWLPIMLEHLSKKEVWIKKEWVFPTVLYLYHFFNKSKVLFLIVFIIYFLYPFQYLFKNIKEEKKFKIEISFYTITLIIWLVLPFALTFTKSLISTPIITIRNLIISLPPAYLLLSRSINQLRVNNILKVLVTFGLILFSLYNLFFQINYYSKPHKEQFREAVYFVADNFRLFENPLIIGYAWSKEHLNYYFKRKGFRNRVEFILGEKQDIQFLENLVNERRPEYIWFIRAHRVPEIEFLNYLRKNYKILIQVSFIECNVWLLKK